MGLGAGFKFKDREYERSNKSRKNLDEASYEAHSNSPSGWTEMVEDWLCHGGPAIAAMPQSPSSSNGSANSPTQPEHPRISSSEPKRGPYQLLVKVG
jgi:hypothetical protein